MVANNKLDIPFLNNNLFSQFPCIFFCKDKDSTFREINNTSLQSIGFECSEEIIGYKDSDLKPFQKNADRYRKQDCYTMEGNCQLNVESLSDLAGNRNLYFIQKTPWLNEYNKIIGVMGFGFSMTRNNFKSILMDFAALKLGFKDFFQNNDLTKTFSYGSFRFSRREAQIVSYLLKDYKPKTIAQKLSISTRTVEHYIETIRFKANIEQEKDFINRAFDTGFIELMFAQDI